LNNEFSDVDTSGVYVCTPEELFGCYGYKPQVSDVRHDNTWFEIGELVRLLMKSNPTVMECLFVPEDKILGPVHPLMQLLLDHREQFISKQCFNPFYGYMTLEGIFQQTQSGRPTYLSLCMHVITLVMGIYKKPPDN
jgi:predicted nucleotidyltransferase